MKVVHTPYYGNRNPYQDNYFEALRNSGINIHFTKFLKEVTSNPCFKKKEIDILHLHWLPSIEDKSIASILRVVMFILRLVYFKFIKRIRIVITAHNILPHDSISPLVDLFFRKIIASLADAIIVHGKSAVDIVSKKWKVKDEDIYIIPHPNYIDDYINNTNIKDSIEKLKMDFKEDKVNILFLGKIRPYKGILDFLRIYKEFSNTETQLIIAGKAESSELDEIIKEEIENTNIQYHNYFIENDDIQYYMKVADVVVLPYKHILSSGAALLAMSFSKPCIVPSEGCLRDILDDKGAFFFNAENYDQSMKKSLSDVYRNKDLLTGMGEYNYQKALEWSWGNMANLTKNIYNILIDNNHDLV